MQYNTCIEKGENLCIILYRVVMSTSITSSTLGKKTYKIIFLGDSGTGKTSIIERFVNNQFEEK